MTRRAAVLGAGFFGAMAFATQEPAAPAPTRRELVVLVHGLARTSLSMRPLAKALEEQGYDVMRFGYSSVCCTIPEIAERLRKKLDAHAGPEPTRVHFVGHSLGNILVRYILTRDSVPPRVGRVVMLAPPNQGALSANRLTPYVGWFLRPTAELRVDSGTTVREIPQVRNVEIGVIAARDDRRVTLAETHLPEEKAHIVVEGGHTYIMFRHDVRRLILEFLRDGTFTPDTTRAP